MSDSINTWYKAAHGKSVLLHTKRSRGEASNQIFEMHNGKIYITSERFYDGSKDLLDRLVQSAVLILTGRYRSMRITMPLDRGQLIALHDWLDDVLYAPENLPVAYLPGDESEPLESDENP